MFLRRITLNGFKSFCEETELELTDGIAAIVGPNGCGKSNIVDAIKWAIGEQKTRSLRANSMTDVIFKGTDSRKPLGRASVTLTITNDNNILNLPFGEVEISRIIYANGENEYIINKEKVRLKDIHELFFDTGFGKISYSVMEQGKIDLILSTKAEDRRYIIEEAAGITKYKTKRDESNAKLNLATENALRARDVLKEVEFQYNNMKEQAEKAILWRAFDDRERELEIELNLKRVENLKNEQKKLIESLEKLDIELSDMKATYEEYSFNIQKKMRYIASLETKKIDTQREVFQVESDIKLNSSSISHIKDLFSNTINSIKQDEDKRKIIEDKIFSINDEIEDIEDRKLDFDDKILNLMKDSDFYTKSINNIEEDTLELQSSIGTMKEEITKSNNRLEKLRLEHRDVTDELIDKIDQSLDTIDVNADSIIKIKQELSGDTIKLLEKLPRDRAFIMDILKIGEISTDSKELISLLKEFFNKLLELEENFKSINENIKKYIDITEIFLDDIFNPKGILQQKRAIEQKIEEININIKKFSKSIEEAEKKIVENQEKKEKYKELLGEIKINLSTILEKKNSIDKEINRIISLKNSFDLNREELKQRIELSNRKKDEFNEKIAKLSDTISILNDKKGEIESLLKELDKNIQSETVKLSEFNKNIKDIHNKIELKVREIETLATRNTEVKTTIKNINDSFYENFSIDLEMEEKKNERNIENENSITDRVYEDIKKELNSIRGKKASLGNVNLAAIDDVKELEARYKLLSEQLDDLEKAKNDILQMVEEINRVSKELFIDTFEKVKINFEKIFKRLFGGGTAEIFLTDSDNILETGIEIMVHPPGQKTQSITLLSGGQRTMIAISLMFAIFLVKPSPFCILDEIDAALDEENIDRFVKLLDEFKTRSQFVMITHNRKTMLSANVMYGVTQEEKGVSKIVSAKFEKENI